MNEDLPIQSTLYSCLALLIGLNRNNKTIGEVLEGLPLTDNHLTPKIFIRAAKKAGIQAAIRKKTLNAIVKTRLPAVILLEPDNAVLAMAYEPVEETVRIIEPGSQKESTVPLNQLKSRYAGYSIEVRSFHGLEDVSESPEEKSDRHWFWNAIVESLPIYRDVLIASILVNTFALASPLFIMNVYDRVVPNQALETLWVLAIGVLIIFSFDLLLRLLRGYFVDVAGKQIDSKVSAKMYQRVLGVTMASRPDSVGAFANNLEEFENVRSFITSATITALIDIPFIVLFLLVIWYLGGMIVLVPLLAIPIILLYALLMQPAIKRAVDRVMKGGAVKSKTLVESLVGIETIKILGAENRQQNHWEKAVDYIARWGMRSRLLSSSVVNVALFIQQMATIGVVVFGVYLIGEGNLSLGGLIAAVILSSRTLSPMTQIANLATHYHQSAKAIKNISQIMELPVDKEAGKTYLTPEKLNGSIEFDAVSFAYPGQPGKALSNVTIKINQGEHVGLIGRTGSGKSTLGKLIAGIYQQDDGFVRIGGLDVRQIAPSTLKENISYVPQDVNLFYGTMRDNIVFGREGIVDDDRLLQAAELSGVLKIVDRHPYGFDLHIGERGIGLSGGQRQGVAIARALVNNAGIVIMDEPSNSMDNSTERELKERISSYIEGKTLVLITHKASMLDLVDRLIVLDNGRVIADDDKNRVIEALSAN